MRVETTQAIVLRTRDYGESDRIVTVLSRDAGKFSGIAKGAKRSRRRFPGSLELFAHVKLDFRYRPGADLAFFERANLLRPWHGILTSLERYAAASHVLELADKLTAEREVGDELYRLVLATLARIDASEPGPWTLRLFELGALTTTGYRTDFTRCALCRRALDTARGSFRVTSTGGGMTCADCTSRDTGGVVISATTLAMLAALQATIEQVATAGARNGTADPSALHAVESSIGVAVAPLVTTETRAALGGLLAPHLRSRLRVLELLGTVVRTL